MAKKNEKIKQQAKISEKVQKAKEEKLMSQEEKLQKSLVIENIKNFYTDRIAEVKEKIEEDKTKAKLIAYEKKRSESMKRHSKLLKSQTRLKTLLLLI